MLHQRQNSFNLKNLIVRIRKSDAKGTNNKRLHSKYCTVEANYWQRRSIARPLSDSRTCRHMTDDERGATDLISEIEHTIGESRKTVFDEFPG